jgi:predicted dehydrogenase
MGEIDTLYGIQANINHPYIEVEDTALAVIRFKSGALGNVIVSNSQDPALYGKVHIFGDNGAGVGVQTDGGSMFIAGMSSITEPPEVDLWTVRGEESLVAGWNEEDAKLFEREDAMYLFHMKQIDDFVNSIIEKRPPLITGEEGRRTTELFVGIYRATRDHTEIKFPLKPEGMGDMDGRITR